MPAAMDALSLCLCLRVTVLDPSLWVRWLTSPCSDCLGAAPDDDENPLRRTLIANPPVSRGALRRWRGAPPGSGQRVGGGRREAGAHRRRGRGRVRRSVAG